MQEPQCPLNEQERLQALRSLRVLDTPFEERFDRITRLAADLFEVPIALVSLVDANRQWFKSCMGLDARETDRNISFCGHAILGAEILMIPDARADARFADNPLVVGEPHIRFYAGAPLTLEGGERVGTLCLIDRQPRRLSEREQGQLKALAEMVERELQLGSAISLAVQLEREQRFKSDFFAKASHELRTPLTALLGGLKLLQATESTHLSDGGRQLLAVAERNGERLARLVNDILDLEKLEQGHLSLRREALDLRVLLPESIELNQHYGAARGIRIGLQLPASPTALIVEGDAQRVHQILANLLSNAIKHSPEGATVGVRVTADDNRVLIDVSDQGPVIPAELLPRLFEKYAQSETSVSEASQGTGLGLVIAREFARAMGGDVLVASEPGAGAVFTLALPAVDLQGVSRDGA